MSCTSRCHRSRWVNRLVACARWTLFAFLAAQLVAGCTTAATIRLNGGAELVGRIEWSDEQHIYIAHEDTTDELAVPRSQVDHIKHPGMAAGIIGALFAVPGFGLLIGGVLKDCPPSPPCEGSCIDWGTDCEWGATGMIIFGMLLTVIGTAPMIWGWSEYAGSRSRARPQEDGGLSVTPIALSDGERTYYGGAVGFRF